MDRQIGSQAAGVALGVRSDWTKSEIELVYAQAFADLIWQAQRTHRQHFDANEVQLSKLLSIKTGGCPEDCAYCAQSAHFETGLKAERLSAVDAVVDQARAAKAAGATRFCMGAAWRSPKERDMATLCTMVARVKALGLETCMTLGMLDQGQADRLARAGLDYYNHNIDTSPEFYAEVITTRSFADRIETLEAVRASGMAVCCGGILGMGENKSDRISFLHALASLPKHPESVPINRLIAMPGTPLAAAAPLDNFELVRTIATARIVMPASMVRLSAGREDMSDELQALCFLAGANSIFLGEKLLTAGNPSEIDDRTLFARLGLRAMGQAPAID